MLTLVVSPKLVPNARRQLEQWQREVLASSGHWSVTVYLMFPQVHLPWMRVILCDV